MVSPRFHLLPATAALLAACGVVSQPAAPPSPSAPPAKEVAAPAAVAAKPAAATAPPKSAPPAAIAKSPPAAPAKAPPVAAAKAPPVVAASAAPPIDLKSLEVKLKDSNAIGLMTKLSLKNQVDDLVTQFRAFHDGRQPPTLAQLRQPYELLLMKVMSLLQDGDPALAKALHESRDYIWGVLADRNKFLANV